MIKYYKISTVIMVFITICSIFSPVTFAAEDHQSTIRIAYPIQEGLTEIDDNGYYSGYTFEYLEKIAQNTGWDYEYVTVPGTLTEQLSTLMDMLDNGEVDLMGGMVYNEATAERFVYCNNKYGTSHTVLQVLNESLFNKVQTVSSNNQAFFRIAICSTTGRMAEEVIEHCKKSNINFSFVECKNLNAGIYMLKNGQADALASSEMFVNDDLQTVATFAPKPFYFATGKDTDSSLMRTLDTALINIKRYNPSYQQELYSKYFSPHANKLGLSKSEQEYIASLHTLNVGVFSNRPPFQHYDPKQGWHGICIDILEYISMQTGISFELIDISDSDEQYDMLLNGKLDFLLGAPYEYSFAREHNILLTEPYAVYSTVLVTGKNTVDLNEIEHLRVAVVAESYSSQQYLPEILLDYKTIYDCLKAVLNGSADCAYLNQLSAQYYLSDPEFSKLKISTFANRESRLCCAMKKSTDPILLNIINRSISTMSSEEQNAIIFQELSSVHEFTLKRYLRENPVVLLIFLGIIAALIALILTLQAKRKAKEARMAKIRLDKHLNLCSLAGDIFVEYNFKKNQLIVSCPDNKYDNHADLFEIDLMKTNEYTQNKAIIDAFIDLLKNGASEPLELQIPFLDGDKHWIELTISKMHDEHNEPLYSLARLKLIDEKFTEQEILKHQAQRDGLTQLYNIGHCSTLIQKRLGTLAEGETDALLIIDIDYFKHVNDTHGHMTGNEVLQAVASTLRKICPDNAIVGRMGGDEFLIYLPCLNHSDEAEILCKALCKEAEKIQLFDQETLSFSIGAAIIDHPIDYRTAFEKADIALYDIKRNGRNNYKVIS